MASVEEPTTDKEPIGGGGLPYSKRARTYGKLPGLSRRQTYNLVVAIPSIQLTLIFIAFILSATDFYKVSYNSIAQVAGFSLLTGLYQWYMAKFSGSCISALVSIYTLIAVCIVNILYSVNNFDYYFIYGAVLTGVGLFIYGAVLSGIGSFIATTFLRRR